MARVQTKHTVDPEEIANQAIRVSLASEKGRRSNGERIDKELFFIYGENRALYVVTHRKPDGGEGVGTFDDPRAAAEAYNAL